MSKYDAVDELMRMATKEAVPVRNKPKEEGRSAEEVLASKVMASEPGMPAASSVPAQPGARPEPVQAASSTVAAQAQTPPGERGRAFLDAMRPLLPAMGGALRRVPHPAGKVAADLLPWLGNLGSLGALGSMVADRMGNRAEAAASREVPAAARVPAPEARMEQLTGELKESRKRLDAQDEQLRRMRESLERTVAEQGTLTHQAHGLADRVRLLMACVLILLMLVAAQIVLLVVYLHR